MWPWWQQVEGVGAVVGAGVGVLGTWTVIVPSIPKWKRQKYWTVPGVLNITEGDEAAEATTWSQESPAPADPRTPFVAVCAKAPSFVQVMVSPAAIEIDDGAKKLSRMLTAWDAASTD